MLLLIIFVFATGSRFDCRHELSNSRSNDLVGGKPILKMLTALFQTIVLLSVSMAANLQSPTAAMRSTKIGVGDVAPDFTLEDQNRNKVTLSDARGKSPVVLVFYRGYW